MSPTDTLIEYKKYFDKNGNPRREKNPFIEHYKDNRIEWFAKSNDRDQEVEFKCITNGFVRATEYDINGNPIKVNYCGPDMKGFWVYQWEFCATKNTWVCVRRVNVRSK